MSEQNTTVAVEIKASKQPVDRTVYKTLEEAQAAKPAGDKLKLFTVDRPDGSQAFTYADGGWNAVVSVAKADGYTVEDLRHGRKKQPTVEDAQKLLAQLDPKVLKAAGIVVKAPKPSPAPTPEEHAA